MKNNKKYVGNLFLSNILLKSGYEKNWGVIIILAVFQNENSDPYIKAMNMQGDITTFSIDSLKLYYSILAETI